MIFHRDLHQKERKAESNLVSQTESIAAMDLNATALKPHESQPFIYQNLTPSYHYYRLGDLKHFLFSQHILGIIIPID